jgi:hypothetical protein
LTKPAHLAGTTGQNQEKSIRLNKNLPLFGFQRTLRVFSCQFLVFSKTKNLQPKNNNSTALSHRFLVFSKTKN